MMSEVIGNISVWGRKIEKRAQSPILRIVVLMMGIGFMIFGCMRGELPVVLGKAITVCLECIGLG